MNTSKIINSNINPLKKQEGLMPEEIKRFGSKTMEFADKILNSSSEEIVEFLKTKTKLIAQKDSNALYSFDNFLLYRSNGDASLKLEQNLELCKNSAITPKFVKFFQLGDNDFVSLLELSPSGVVPYRQAASQISDNVKQKFIADLQKLNNTGLINRKVFTEKDLYFATKNNKNIIFADWSEIHFLSPQEKMQMTETLKNMKI